MLWAAMTWPGLVPKGGDAEVTMGFGFTLLCVSQAGGDISAGLGSHGVAMSG